MNKQINRALAFSKFGLIMTLCLGLVFPPQLDWSFLSGVANAADEQSGSLPELDPAAAVDRLLDSQTNQAARFNEDISKLHQILSGTHVGIHPLDPFGALSQRIVHHGPKGRILPTLRENLNIVLGDYLDLNETLSPEQLGRYLGWVFEALPDANGKLIYTLNQAEFKDQIRLSSHFDEFSKLSLGQLKHLAKEVADRLGIRADEAVLLLESKYNVFNNVNSVFRKLDRHMMDVLARMDDENRVVRRRDFKGSTLPGFSTGNLVRPNVIEWHPLKPTFSFFAGGKVIQEFSLPVQSMFFYGNYLVLLEPGAFIEEQGVHYLTYIDLKKYEAGLGKVGQPIFKIPIKADRPISDIRIQNGNIVVNDQKLTPKTMEAWSDLSEIFYNSMVNMMDMDKAESAAAKLTDFAEYIYEAQRVFGEHILATNGGVEDATAQKLFNDYSNKMMETLKRQAAVGRADKFADIADKLGADFKQAQQVQLATKQYAERNMMNRSLLNRAQLLMVHLTVPRPDGIPVLQRSFAHMAAAFSFKKDARLAAVPRSASADFREGTLQLLNHPYVKWGLPVAAAAVVGVTNPEAASAFLYQVDSVARAGVYAVFGKLYQFSYLGYETVSQTFKGMNPVFLGEYLWKFGKYLAAGGATAAGMVLGPAFLSHWLVNSIRLGIDLDKMSGAEKVTGNLFERMYKHGRNILSTFNGQTFLKQQRELRAKYLKDLSSSAQAEQNKNDGKDVSAKAADAPVFTAQDDLRVQEIIAKIRDEREEALNQRWAYRAWKATKTNGKKVWSWLRKKELAKAAEIAKGETTPNKAAEEDIKSVRGAVGHFLMSWPTLTVSQKGLAKYFWNSWFLFRSFFFHPIVATRAVAQPYYAFTAASDRKLTTIPSEMNGGTRWIWEWMRLQFFDTDHLEDLRAWEKKIIPVERMIHTVAVSEAFKATARLAQDSSELREIYKKGRFDNWASGAVKSVTARFRIFFRSYAEGLQEAATQRFVADYLTKLEPKLMDKVSAEPIKAQELAALYEQMRGGDMRAVAKMKSFATQELEGLEITPAEATKLVQEVAKDEKIFESSRALSSDGGLNKMRRVIEVSLGQNVLAKLDRKNNRQIDRVFTVNEKLDDPQAVARGVRYVASGWKVSYPLSILSTLVLLAGVESDMLELVHPDAMFSDQSFMYLSRYVVLGMVLNMVLSVVGGSDLWMKVQIDEQHDGHFNKRLEGAEAQMNLFQLWVSKSFKNPDNTLWQNHSHYVNRIMLPNMKAALFNFALAYFATVGRFDLGAYLTSYSLAFAVPKYSFDMLMDQGFELAASGYLVSQFPPELVAHPKVQAFINSESGKWRDIYNIGNKGYEVTSQQLMENLELLKTDKMGTRTLERILFGGWSVAELAYNGLEHGKSVLRPLPGAQEVLTLCEKLLTNNMEPSMFQNIQHPPWVKPKGAPGL